MEILSEYQTNVRRALGEIKPDYEKLDALVICGTHSPNVDEVDGMIEKIKHARETGRPFLGICYGYQLATIEYARNVLGIKDATSEEFGTSGTPVVKKLDTLNVGLKDGESYWNNYAVSIDWPVPENFFVSQFHPEYQSMKGRPHRLLVNFLNYARH